MAHRYLSLQLSLVCGIGSLPILGQSPKLPCTVSWLGNSYPGGKNWIQQDIKGMCVTDDGTVFTNVEWEEGGGQAGMYRDGILLGYARHTHGWGALGGEAVAVNSNYVFLAGIMHNEGGGLKDPNTWPDKGLRWFGVSRRLRSDFTKAAPFRGGKGGKGDTLKECFRVVNEVPEKTNASVAGLAATQGRLFVSNPYRSQIEVLDANTMQRMETWPCERPGPVALDKKGFLWVFHRPEPGKPAGFSRFSPDSKRLPVHVWFEPDSVPAAFCLAPNGDVMVADDGPRQQIGVYRLEADGVLRLVKWRGERGGIYAGIPGVIGDGRFNRPSAIGCDAKGNLFVAHDGQTGGGGTVLESYTSDGRLNWRLFGLEFVDMADLDPDSDRDLFTKEEHFRMDYAKSPGGDWTYAGYTVHRFRYPQDPRLHIWSAGAWMRRINSQRFLFVNDMNAEHLQVYRFAPATDGEIAIPCAFFAKRHLREKEGWPPNQPDKGGWIWRDLNGNGAFDPGEFDSSRDLPTAQGWWVDVQGNIWLATEKDGLLCWTVAGLDAHGVPIWGQAGLRRFPHPAGFDRLKRLRYDPASDVMYLGGTTAEHKNQHWKPMGPAIARYDGWLKGEARQRWQLVAPYDKGSQGHSSCEPMGFDLAGDHLFIPYTGESKPMGIKTGHIEVFRTSDGSPVGHMEPPAEIGEIGLQDIRECLRAHRRADGEYLVFLEEDYKAKLLMYRWRP